MSRPRRSVRRPPSRPPGEPTSIDIREIGARGDGVAAGAGGAVYIPFTLPGERVRAMIAGERGELLALERASPERVAPPCAHFGRCGGCQLQHWADAPYLAWKREQVSLALRRRGIEAAVEPAVVAWGEGRRRAAFHAERRSGGVVLGFVERGGARIEPVEACPVLVPALSRALPGLRRVADAFAPPRGGITLQCFASETGLDVNVLGAGAPHALDREALEISAALAEALDLARLSLEGEPLLTRRAPVATMGGARVVPPPGAFLQATRAGERALSGLVTEAVAGARRVADLFSGVGTFALPLAASADVHAVEGDAEMLEALAKAARSLAGGRGVTIEQRDLLREPLTAGELSRFDAVVFDPPRAGARAQAEEIGRATVARVAAVSCDPATLARDVRILIDAGFALRRVTPVDQFRWSAHVEAVAILER